jgi:hypothetical protein
MADRKQTIINKAKELALLDRECIELNYERKTARGSEEIVEYLSELMTICSQAFHLKNEIQLLLIDTSNINIHDNELETLIRKIRNDEKIYSVSQYEVMASTFNKGLDDTDEQFDIDTRDYILHHPEAFTDFHGEIDYVAYFVGSMKVGTLISRRRIPDASQAYFNEIRESFAFGLYRASTALCRVMLESVYFETLNRRDYFTPDNSKVIKLDLAKDDRLFRLIKDAYAMKITDYDTKEDAFFVKNHSNTMVLHPKNKKHHISENIAFEVISKTINVVEILYEK